MTTSTQVILFALAWATLAAVVGGAVGDMVVAMDRCAPLGAGGATVNAVQTSSQSDVQQTLNSKTNDHYVILPTRNPEPLGCSRGNEWRLR